MRTVPVAHEERLARRHKVHVPALLSPLVIFLALLLLTDWNAIHASSLALLGGGLFTWICRPDLIRNMLAGSLLFACFYYLYFLTLILVFPGYVEKVWNLSAISGMEITGVPVEELMFALTLGFCWSSVYEHLRWRKFIPAGAGIGKGGGGRSG